MTLLDVIHAVAILVTIVGFLSTVSLLWVAVATARYTGEASGAGVWIGTALATLYITIASASLLHHEYQSFFIN